MNSLEERAIADYDSLTREDKNLLLAIESYMFRTQGGRTIYNKKFSKTFKEFLHKKGLDQMIIDFERKGKVVKN